MEGRKIVYFTIGNNRCFSVFGDDGLVAAWRIDDGQPAVSKGCIAGGENPLGIRTAVDKTIHDHLGKPWIIRSPDRYDATHVDS